MIRKLTFSIIFIALANLLHAQISFENQTKLLKTASIHSGVGIAVADVNGDGQDDVVRMNKTRDLQIEFQTSPNQPFGSKFIAHLDDGDLWGMAAADVDNDGFGDVLTGGPGVGIILVKIKPSEPNGYTIQKLNVPATDALTFSFADPDGDGWLDALAINESGLSRFFKNDGAGNLSYEPSAINFASFPVSDNSGSYGAVWTDVDNDCDLDLYVSKSSEEATDPTDPRRLNQLFWNTTNPDFTQDILNTSGLRIGALSRSADFGDIDNDGDMDCFLINHYSTCQILMNDGQGHFTDVTAAAGIKDTITGLGLQGIWRDFDNDGLLDLIVAGTRAFYFQNIGNRQFVRQGVLPTCNPIESFAVGDLNSDGFLDFYAGYANYPNAPTTINDALFLNKGNANHFLGITLRGKQSNRQGVGARVTLYTPHGRQIREVRAGEGFGISNSLRVHFGLGTNTEIDSVAVVWPNCKRDVYRQVTANQYVTLEEGGCLVEQIKLAASGPTTFCPGESVTLSAPAGYSYTWSTGETTASIVVKNEGNFQVTVTNPQGCSAVSNGVGVVVDPVEIPLVEVLGDSVLCAGTFVNLSVSTGSNWLWSTGETTQSITVSTPGPVWVRAMGLCKEYTSVPVQIRVLTPALPVPTGDTTWVGGTAVLKSTGDEPHWFDAPTGGVELFRGNPFVTPPLFATKTFYVANNDIEDTSNVFLGMPAPIGSTTTEQYNGGLIFEAYKPFILKSVKVFSTADVPKDREIEVFNEDGEEILKKVVNVPVGQSKITLNFEIPAGDDFLLTTGELLNLQNFGSESPQFRHSDQGINYPYEIEGVAEIKSSNNPSQPGNRYYYFFDWEIDFIGHACLSERLPVVARVDPNMVGADDWAVKTDLKIAPNPATDEISVQTEGIFEGQFFVKILDAQGRILKTENFDATQNADFQLKTSELPAGIFILEISDGERRAFGRFVKN